MPLDELLNLPDEDIINEILNEDQILSAVIDLFKDRSGESVNDMDEEDDSEEQKIITTGEAAASLEILNKYLLQQEGASNMLKLVGKIENFVSEEKLNYMCQTTIEDFFPSIQ